MGPRTLLMNLSRSFTLDLLEKSICAERKQLCLHNLQLNCIL